MQATAFPESAAKPVAGTQNVMAARAKAPTFRIDVMCFSPDARKSCVRARVGATPAPRPHVTHSADILETLAPRHGGQQGAPY
jgi:hypothetical protein